MKSFPIRHPIFILSIFLMFFLLSCQSSDERDSTDGLNSEYVSFTQNLSGLFTGTTDLNGTLRVFSGWEGYWERNENPFPEIPIQNGSFTVLPEDHRLVAGRDVYIKIETGSGITKILWATAKEDGFYFYYTDKKISHLLERAECIKNISSGRDRDSLSASINSSPDHDVSYNLITLMQALYTRWGGYGMVWEKKPVVLIYDRSIWKMQNQKWVLESDEVDRTLFNRETSLIRDFFSGFVPSLTTGIWSGGIQTRRESTDGNMPTVQEALDDPDECHVVFLHCHRENFPVTPSVYHQFFTEAVEDNDYLIKKSFLLLDPELTDYFLASDSDLNDFEQTKQYYQYCLNLLLGTENETLDFSALFNRDFTASSDAMKAIMEMLYDGDPGVFFGGSATDGYYETYPNLNR